MKKNRKQSVLRGALILSGAGALCKVLGMVYRILLSNILGTQGMGNYQLAYSVYGMLLVVASGGMPAALSASAAKRLAKRDVHGAWEYFRAARGLMAWLGVAAAVLLYVGSGLISRMMGMPSVSNVLKAAAPAILFVALTSAYRGYSQGTQQMLPCATSQICEQIVKLTAGLWLSSRLIHKGDAWGALGAMLGVSLSELAGLLAVRICTKNPRISVRPQVLREKTAELLRMALPITLGSAIVPMLGSADSLLSMQLLQKAGFAYDAASGVYGLYSGFVMPVVHLPGILASAISMSMVPAVASAVANDRKDLQHRHLSLGIKAVCLLGIPVTVGIWVLAQPILQLLYKNLDATELMQATELLRLMAPSALFAMIAQVTGGMLQGLGYMLRPAVHMALGAVVKILLGILLIPLPNVHIRGAAIGSVVCYLVTAILNVVSVLRKGNGEYRFADCWLKPAAASTAMAAAAVWIYRNVGQYSQLGAVLSAVLGGIVVYIVGIYLLGALRKNDWGKQKTAAPMPLTNRSI